MEAISAVDVAALAIVAVAVLRGLLIGVIREVFSLFALAAACVAVRLGTAPGAEWLLQNLSVEIGPLAARIAAAVVLVIAVILSMTLVGRILRRGARWVGLGFFDRLAGGALGAAEGALVIVILLLFGFSVVGRDHPALANTRTVAAFENAERLAQSSRPALPQVASPPPEHER